MAQKIVTPQVVVLLEQPGSDELVEMTIQTDNRDMVRFDMTRAHRRWPSSTDASILWLTFLAWSALDRNNLLDGEKFDDFQARCVQVDDPNRKDKGEAEEEIGADPTR